MKRLIAALLCLGMLLSFAFAERLPYARSIEGKGKPGNNLLTEETYPELCLTPASPPLYIDYPKKEPVFLCAPFPQGAHPAIFDYDVALLIDNDNNVSYNYGLFENRSFEAFLSPSEYVEKEIIRDGTDGSAAYIDISFKKSAFGWGMIKTPQFGEDVFLVIEVHMYDMDESIGDKEQRRMITTAIEQEIDRIRSEMRYETIRPYMNAGKFGGIKMMDYDSRVLAVFDFFPLKVHKVDFSGKDYGIVSSDMILTRFDGTQMKGYFPCGDGWSAEMEMDLNKYGTITKRYMNNEENTGVIRMDNGSEWYYSMPNRNDDGSVSFLWAEKKVEGFTSKDDSPYYITFCIKGSGSWLFWDSPEECFEIIKEIESNLRFVEPKDDPYVPGM